MIMILEQWVLETSALGCRLASHCRSCCVSLEGEQPGLRWKEFGCLMSPVGVVFFSSCISYELLNANPVRQARKEQVTSLGVCRLASGSAQAALHVLLVSINVRRNGA